MSLMRRVVRSPRTWVVISVGLYLLGRLFAWRHNVQGVVIITSLFVVSLWMLVLWSYVAGGARVSSNLESAIKNVKKEPGDQPSK